jgi:hypothetical protein
VSDSAEIEPGREPLAWDSVLTSWCDHCGREMKHQLRDVAAVYPPERPDEPGYTELRLPTTCGPCAAAGHHEEDDCAYFGEGGP